MAVVTYGNGIEAHKYVPDYFEPNDDSKINTRTATVFQYTNSDGSVVRVTGTGFTYVNGVPVAGNIAGITVREGAATVLTISGLNYKLYDFYYDAFGWDREGHPRENGNGWNLFKDILAGNDTINGSSKGDDIIGGANEGNDLVRGNGGDDYIKGDKGNDTLNGGAGGDTLSYSETHFGGGPAAVRGIDLNVATGTVIDAWGNTDKFTGFEGFEGSKFNDNMRGNGADNFFEGLRGADTINGGGAAGSDWDIANYSHDVRYGGNFGIIANFETGRVRDGFGSTDRISNIEQVRGTKFNDTFVGGTANENSFVGLDGKDNYTGGTAYDIVELWGGSQGVVLNMTLASNQIVNDGYGNSETYSGSIDEFSGGDFGDNFLGDGTANRLYGSAGNDTLSGGGGNDRLRGESGNDLMTGGAGGDDFQWRRQSDGFGADTITDFQSGADDIVFFTASFAGMDTTVRFNIGTAASGAGSSFFFNTATDTLFWDRDGTGTTFSAVAVVQLTGLATMVAGDIELWA